MSDTASVINGLVVFSYTCVIRCWPRILLLSVFVVWRLCHHSIEHFLERTISFWGFNTDMVRCELNLLSWVHLDSWLGHSFSVLCCLWMILSLINSILLLNFLNLLFLPFICLFHMNVNVTDRVLLNKLRQSSMWICTSIGLLWGFESSWHPERKGKFSDLYSLTSEFWVVPFSFAEERVYSFFLL